jgi:mono/diheme cytochrome c family protein
LKETWNSADHAVKTQDCGWLRCRRRDGAGDMGHRRHGPDLEGQPNWQTPQADGTMPAPPLNASGHALHHPQAELFRIVKRGMASVKGGPTNMPPFENVLTDEEITAVIAYLRSTW